MTESIARDAEVLTQNIAGVVVAREEVVRQVVICLLAGGHLLLHDLPGVGKTLVARSIAASIEGSFKRIQFTPDLMPSDITGSSIFHQVEGRFEFIPGPIFANIVLADEVNRASARTQSALLEAMAEGQVTVDGRSYLMADPFWVIATQNEIDGFGTFRLPQPQLDRFMMALSIGYPNLQDQVTILERNQEGDPVAEPILTTAQIKEMQAEVRQIETARSVREYMARIIVATRSDPRLALGASPRAGVHLQRASQAMAALQGYTFVAPEHVKAMAVPVLVHRIIPSPSSALVAEDIIQNILQEIPVPS